jgi:CRP-like cAMP-binding protein
MPDKTSTPAQRKSESAKTATNLHLDAHSMLMSVGAGRSIRRHKEGEVVFRQGDPADAVFFIETGNVRPTVVSEQGKEGVIAMLGAGEFFGEGCLAGQPLHMASATATALSEVVRVEKGAMVRLLHEQPTFSEMFMTFLLARNVRFEEDLVDQLFNSSEKRLARVLLLLANFGKDGKMEPVIPKISQEVLAARVGTTRPRINYFMNKFRKLGLIEYNGELKVHTALLNVILHD